GDLRQRFVIEQATPPGGHLEYAPRHGGVVCPLPRRETAQAAADHPGAVGAGRRRAVLVAGAESVTHCGPQHHAGDPVAPCRSCVVRHHAAFPPSRYASSSLFCSRSLAKARSMPSRLSADRGRVGSVSLWNTSRPLRYQVLHIPLPLSRSTSTAVLRRL